MGHDVCLPRQIDLFVNLRSVSETIGINVRILATEKTEKSLAEVLILVSLVAILMTIFIYYFFKQEDNFTATGLQSLKNSFASKVRIIHAQWMIDDQPKQVALKYSYLAAGEQKLVYVDVNQQGWVDSHSKQLYCEKIWLAVMEQPMVLMKTPISVIELRTKQHKYTKLCRYAIADSGYFEYNPHNGKVNLVESR